MEDLSSLNGFKHRWSGWPGAWCLDCGIADPTEEAIAHGCDSAICTTCRKDYCLEHDEIVWTTCSEHVMTPCPEPNSHRFDPYYRDPSEQYGTPEHEAWLIEMEQQEG